MDVLILLMVVSFAVTVIGMRASSLWEEHDRAIVQAQAASRDLARITEEYASRVFETSDMVASETIRHIRERGGTARARDGADSHRYLLDLSRRTTGDHIVVVDRAGIPAVVTTQFSPPVVDLSDRDWFKAHVAGADRHIGKAIVSRITGEVMFTYSRAIRDADGSLEGAVQISKTPHFFQQVSLTNDLVSDVILTVWNHEGDVIARTGITPDQVGRNYAGSKLFMRMLGGETGTFEEISPFDDRDRIVSFRKLDRWPVIVSASVPRASALIAFHESVRQSVWQLAMVLFGLTVLTVIALRLSHREAAAQATLRSANKALMRSRDDLELRVVERTRELADAAERTRGDEARFRGIFNSTFQFMGLLRPDGTVLEINQTALSFAGVSPGDVLGKPFWKPAGGA
jgi:PAS domain-containing protein